MKPMNKYPFPYHCQKESMRLTFKVNKQTILPSKGLPLSYYHSWHHWEKTKIN